MKAEATTWRVGLSGILPTTSASAKKKKKRRKKKAPGGFMCGCGGTRSVSVVNIISAATTPPPPPMKKKQQGAPTAAAASSAGHPPAKTTTTTAGFGRHADADDANAEEGSPSVGSLLRQLRELERGVRALGVRERDDFDGGEGGGAAGRTTATATARPPPARPRRREERGGSVLRGRLELESERCVAVVTETADPLGDFRRSMAEMVVENGITGGAELRELLRRFLALNDACHHGLILQAFADVCREDLFAAPAHSHGDGGGGGGRAEQANVRPRGRADTLRS